MKNKTALLFAFTVLNLSNAAAQPGYGGINGGDAPGASIDAFAYILIAMALSYGIYKIYTRQKNLGLKFK